MDRMIYSGRNKFCTEKYGPILLIEGGPKMFEGVRLFHTFVWLCTALLASRRAALNVIDSV